MSWNTRDELKGRIAVFSYELGRSNTPVTKGDLIVILSIVRDLMDYTNSVKEAK